MSFNYSEYAKIFTDVFKGKSGTTYTYAEPDKVAAQNPTKPRAARNEYRRGLADMSKGYIKTFDVNGDGKWDKKEFAAKEADMATRIQYAANGIDINGLTESQRRQFEATRAAMAEEQKDMNELSFGVLDLNGDGVIDYKEVAAETALADVNDKSNQDGKLDASGYDRIYNPQKVSPQKLKAELQKTYNTVNLKNLGEPGDIE